MNHFDFKKEWEKTKKKLIQFSKEATKMAQKSEQEIVEFSRRGKVHVDSTTIHLKKERLYYLIGRQYAQSKDKTKVSTEMQQLLDEYKSVNQQQKFLKRKLGAKSKGKK